MHSKRSWRQTISLALTTVTAASVLLSGCGTSQSPPPAQMSGPGLVTARSDAELPASAAQRESLPPAAEATPASPPDTGSGGSGNPAAADDSDPPETVTVWQAGADSTDDEFLLVADLYSLPQAVQVWHDTNREFEGAFQLTADGQHYLLISAGAMPTGGYSLSLRSLTQTDSGWRVEVNLHRPSPQAMVTQVVTYPSLFFTTPPGDVEVVLYDGLLPRELPLNGAGATH